MGKRPMRLQAVVSVTISEKYICNAFAELFGGYVRLQNPKRKNENHNDYYIWNLTGPKIIEFCDQMIPLLTIKKERAELIRDFQSLKSSIGNQPISDSQYDLSVDMYQQFRKLNKRGQK